jgi:hypothetical protein
MIKCYTNYPFYDDDVTYDVKEVILLSYDRNKYAEVEYNGEIHSIKGGYLYKDKELSKRLKRWKFKVPTEHGEKIPTRKEYAAETKNLRKRKKSESYYVLVDSITYRLVKKLKNKIAAIRALAHAPVYTEMLKYYGYNNYEIVNKTDTGLVPYRDQYPIRLHKKYVKFALM